MHNLTVAPCQDIFVVKDSPFAMGLIRKLAEAGAGSIIRVTHEEFKALKNDVIRVDVSKFQQVGIEST